jgi:hypothetical protein
MHYIVIGARVDHEKTGEGHVYTRALPALQKARELEAEGYTVRIQVPDGKRIDIARLEARITAGKAL